MRGGGGGTGGGIEVARTPPVVAAVFAQLRRARPPINGLLGIGMKEKWAMMNLAGTAERLRTVQEAQDRFLAMFALECIWDQPRPYDRLANDLQSFDGPPEPDFACARRLGDY